MRLRAVGDAGEDLALARGERAGRGGAPCHAQRAEIPALDAERRERLRVRVDDPAVVVDLHERERASLEPLTRSRCVPL